MDLDNPLFASLQTLHRPFAIASRGTLRYPPEVAPFAAIPEAGPVDLPPGETRLLVGPQPEGAESLGAILQMVCEEQQPLPEGPEIVPLAEAHRPAALALTALVYPHYFRPRTMELGRYFGIVENGRLAAMIGERMGSPSFREISAVCAHPDFAGRGLARRLLVFLGNDLLASGLTAMLHVSPQNSRAVKLYEQNGWRVRREMPFWKVSR
jgi:ribosomal protein S18 acetylase RimI-like enzyme